MNEPVIRVENISKKYRLGAKTSGTLYHQLWQKITQPVSKSSEFWALKDISFEVNVGEVIGIIGPNGAGKSTLLKILSKITEPTKGKAYLKGRVSSLLEVGTGFHPELTGRENVYLNGSILGMRRKEIEKKFSEIVEFSGVERFIDTPVKHYSSGMYLRLAFAIAAHLNSEILLVDEVLAVGDAEFQQKCLGKMEEVSQQEGRTILFVSHNLNAIQKLCSQTIMLDHGQIVGKSNAGDELTTQFQGKTINQKHYDHPEIEKVDVQGSTDSIEINVSVNFTELTYLELGFIISEMSGHQLFGFNVHNPGRNSHPIINVKSEKICLQVLEPKLKPGNYKLQIWVNANGKNILSDTQGLILQIAPNDIYPQISSNILGKIIPEVIIQY